MLNLKLRDEFLGAQMPDTAIELRRSDNKGAAQRDAEYILGITYPTADVQTALRQISTVRGKRPIVLMGDRGRGKSHIMAVLHHAIESPEKVEQWARGWGDGLDLPALKELALERGFFPISEAVHNNEYPLLWNLLFDRHPKGEEDVRRAADGSRAGRISEMVRRPAHKGPRNRRQPAGGRVQLHPGAFRARLRPPGDSRPGHLGPEQLDRGLPPGSPQRSGRGRFPRAHSKAGPPTAGASPPLREPHKHPRQ